MLLLSLRTPVVAWPVVVVSDAEMTTVPGAVSCLLLILVFDKAEDVSGPVVNVSTACS